MKSFAAVILLGVFSSCLAKYDAIWNDMLVGSGSVLTPDMIREFFRGMMNPVPTDPETPTAVFRQDFKDYWMPRYNDPERVADGLFSYFDFDQNQVINAVDLPNLMNIADLNTDGVIDRPEFEAFMDGAYAFAEQRLFPHENEIGHAHPHNGHAHGHHGKPFFG